MSVTKKYYCNLCNVESEDSTQYLGVVFNGGLELKNANKTDHIHICRQCATHLKLELKKY